MRVYELAKQHGLTSKDLLEVLKKGGFDSFVHMSVLTSDALSYLEKNFLKKSTEKKEAAPGPAKPSVEKIQPQEIKKVVESASKPQPSSPMHKTTHQASLERGKSPLQAQPEKPSTVALEPKKPKEIILDKDMPLFEFADRIGRGSGEVIIFLMKQGLVCNRNHLLELDLMEAVAKGLGVEVVIKRKIVTNKESLRPEQVGSDLRWPIVVVMGHVDHGKTTLLDFIRKTNVAQKEKGGITQHLGAYEVDSAHGKIVFLDTPGHEAFGQMRRHGVRVTDLAVLVVAADDGVKPQTLEAIAAAKSANVPIIVAINKIDKVSGPMPLETIKRQLAEQDLLPEDWGGSTICVPISAKTGQGIEELLEMIVLQSQLMELKANPKDKARGFVLETSMERGLGPVATVVVVDGTLKIGDVFVCGDVVGSVKFLLNSSGEKINQAGPSTPVQVVGFDKLPCSGDVLDVVSRDAYLEAKSEKARPSRVGMASASPASESDALNIILKTDTYGTREAILDSFKKMAESKEDQKHISLVSAGIGSVSEGDVALALNTEALIVAMHVKIEKNAQIFAKEHGVKILHHNIIYHLLEEIEALVKKEEVAQVVFKKVGEAEVIKVFDVKGTGVIAGSRVRSGIFTRDSKVVCLRAGRIVGEGMVGSLQRERKSIKEVSKGIEFAFISKGFQDWQLGDIVECHVASTEKKS